MKIEFDLTYDDFLECLKKERKINMKIKELAALGFSGLANDICDEILLQKTALELLFEKNEHLGYLSEFDEFYEDLNDSTKDIDLLAQRCWNFICSKEEIV